MSHRWANGFFSNKYFLKVAYICEIVALNIQKNLKKTFWWNLLLTLLVPTLHNGQTHSNNFLVLVNELFVCLAIVWGCHLGHNKMILCLANMHYLSCVMSFICFKNIDVGAFFIIKCPILLNFQVLQN